MFPELGSHNNVFYGIIRPYNHIIGVSMNDLAGMKFGKWSVLAEVGRGSKGEKLYECKCKCGFIKNHVRSTLTRKISTQCKACRMIELNKREDLSGKKFGSWLVGEKIKNEERNEWFYKCTCDCGTKKEIAAHQLKSNHTTKCHICRNKTHGMSYTDTFRIWSGILRRCTNKNVKAYPRYGGRGISVCERWLKFENFYADMGDRPKGLQIDRINNDGNYEPSNCRWATCKENVNNRNNSKNKKEI